MYHIKYIIDRYYDSSNRSKKVLKNIALSIISKGITIICSLLVVPLTINYVNPTRYGIWLSLSSIIGWIGYFDLGLGNGFRNKYAEAKAFGNYILAKQYISTTYLTITIIMSVLFIALAIGNMFVDWAKVLNVDDLYSGELSMVFYILMFFFCMNMIVRLFTTLLTADQKPGVASVIWASGQILSVCSIFILTRITEGNLTNLALFYSSIPTIFLFLCSLYAFNFTHYREFVPRLRFIDLSLVKNVMNLGLQFFVIYLCLIVIFQITNIVISRELGPDSVTEYNIAYKYFVVLHNTFLIIITPFWSSFTDAYVKKEFAWMKNSKKTLEKVWLCTFIVALIMFFVSDIFYSFWIGDSVQVDKDLSLMLAIYIVLMNIGAMYMNLINGIGTMRIQLIIYLLFALISYPLMIFLVHRWGIIGVISVPTLVVLVQAIFAKVQIEKIINGQARGIWIK